MIRPRIRFGLRRMMLAVAILAALFYAAETLRRISAYRLEKSREHANLAWIEDPPHPSRYGMGGSPDRLKAARAAWERRHRIFLHHRDLAAKYERAARRPWLPVPPDPPEPE